MAQQFTERLVRRFNNTAYIEPISRANAPATRP